MTASAPIPVTVRFFASLREALGCEALALHTSAATVGELRALLREQSADFFAPTHAAAAAAALSPERAVRCAFNHRMCAESQQLEPAAEVAFFPPVTGG